MSVLLKSVPTVLFDPDVLLELGQKICRIIRETLILDPKMEDICNAVEREGRTLKDILERNKASTFTKEYEETAMRCERAYILLKTAIRINCFRNDSEHSNHALSLYKVFETPIKKRKRWIERIKEVIVILETAQMQNALMYLELLPFYRELKEEFERYETFRQESALINQPDPLPSIRAAASLYGDLLDTLTANVRFVNYQMIHQAELVVNRIESVVNEAVITMIKRQKHKRKNTSTPEIAVA